MLLIVRLYIGGIDIDEAIKAAPTMMAAAPVDKKKKAEEEKAKEEAALEGLGALFGQLNQKSFLFLIQFR